MPFVMSGENVVVDVSKDGAVVAGTYRFQLKPDEENWRGIWAAWIDLPIPVPESERIGDGLLYELNPELIFEGVVLKARPTHYKYMDLPPIKGVKYMFVGFDMLHFWQREFEITIRYSQPQIRVGARTLVYYVPLLPDFDNYKSQLGLTADSFAISFRAAKGSTLKAIGTPMKTLQSTPRLISFEAHDREVLGVELVLDSP